MHLTRIFPTLAAVLFAFLSLAAVAQQPAEPGGPPPEPAVSLARIQRDLARMVELLEGLRTQQQQDLLLKRIDLKERRMAPMEARLLAAEETLHELKGRIAEAEQFKEQLDRTVEQEILAGIDMPGSDTRNLQQEVSAQLQELTERLDATEQKVRLLSGELAGDRKALDALDRELRDLLQ